MKPLCIDVFCGLGGWTEGFLAEGWECIGFDIERHDYGSGGYPAQLVLQDALTIHGKQFASADCLVMSPPCQEFSYMAMPWSRGKQIARALRGEDEFPEGYAGSRTIEQLTALFRACFRIQREAIEAAAHFIPLVVENVKGANPWVGQSRWNFGSFHLYGDVPALMPITKKHIKVAGFRFDGSGKSFQTASVEGLKTVCLAQQRDGHSNTRHLTNQAEHEGVKQHKSGRAWLADPDSISGATSSKSGARKAASAAIAKIPEPLARYIAKVYYPLHETKHNQARRQVQQVDGNP